MAAVKEEFRNILTEERETHKKEVEKLKQLMESKMAELRRGRWKARWLSRRRR